jgi:exodeoxyribonuclease V beta subunit
MKAIGCFDLLESPLRGTNLIEASAGTGKTYTLAALFLRLLLERELAVNQILVVTYTVAATEELRDRIRKKLREARESLLGGGGQDEFLDGLRVRIPDVKKATAVLQEALRDFDEAPIFTIHGFCQRILKEKAFESGILFDTELIPNPASLEEEVVQDFWRKHFYAAPSELVSYAQRLNYRPEFFLDLLKNRVAHPDLQLIPEIGPQALTTLPRLQEAFARLGESWLAMRAEVQEKLADPALDQRTYKNPGQLAAAMDHYVAAAASRIPPFADLEKFTPDRLAALTKKKHKTPHHPFFDLCADFQDRAEALQAELDRQLLFLKNEVFRYVNQELPRRKQKQNVQSFDDLLIGMKTALEKRGGDELAQAVRSRFHAALIDEFQDTDPVQYAIFQNIFGEKGTLFLIGDPKQAIYSFRGADLFSYTKAAKQVHRNYTLTKNRRSEEGLIMAVNAIFSGAADPFVFEAIPFDPAEGPEGKKPAPLRIDGKSDPALHLWFIDAGRVAEAEKLIPKERARDLISRAVAGEISRLIHLGRRRKALIEDKAVEEADIAVLVRTNYEAQLMQEALHRSRIPSVLYSTGNLFDTPEALGVERVLAAIAEPQQEPILRAALATDIMGVKGEDLELLIGSESRWETRLARFQEYNAAWDRSGFIKMFRNFLLREGVRTRLLSFPDGERRLTNVLHLMEMLHQEATERKLGINGLLKWLSRQRDPASPRLEEHQLRLESDAQAVKIVTIHKSKGLEYPIVFCPFNWGGSQLSAKKTFAFHDERNDWRLSLVLDPEESSNRSAAERELLAENVRLLYVSLTRAKQRCYLIWGRIRDAETSALAYLLHPPLPKAENAVAGTGRHFRERTDREIRADLDLLVESAQGTIQMMELPTSGMIEPESAKELEKEFSCRVFPGSLDREWRIASFSSLLSARKEEAKSTEDGRIDLPDHDQQIITGEQPPAEEPSGMFAFPRGTKTGLLLHEIFEHLDFTAGDAESMKKLVTEKLAAYGLAGDWQDTLCAMISRVLTVSLPSKEAGLTLSQIGMKDRLNELEFYFPLKPVTPEKLRRIFAEYGPGTWLNDFPSMIEDLGFHPARGFMKGFIDLVFQSNGRFYLVDWKSNFLGPRLEDYHRGALAEEMAEKYYILQFHLYALALNQYLKTRLPDYSYENHFGGGFYVFLRGVDPTRGANFGIYSEYPKKELIEALGRELIAV